MRLALSSEVTVVIDERDEVALGEQDSDEVMIEQVRISQRVSFNSCPYGKLKTNAYQKVKIRSIDNYQGEEADVRYIAGDMYALF